MPSPRAWWNVARLPAALVACAVVAFAISTRARASMITPVPVAPAAEVAQPSWVFFRDRGDLAKPGPARDAALAEASRRISPRAMI